MQSPHTASPPSPQGPLKCHSQMWGLMYNPETILPKQLGLRRAGLGGGGWELSLEAPESICFVIKLTHFPQKSYFPHFTNSREPNL